MTTKECAIEYAKNLSAIKQIDQNICKLQAESDKFVTRNKELNEQLQKAVSGHTTFRLYLVDDTSLIVEKGGIPRLQEIEK